MCVGELEGDRVQVLTVTLKIAIRLPVLSFTVRNTSTAINPVVRMEFTTKFCVKVSQVVYISAATYQKAFMYGLYLHWRVGIDSMIPDPRVHAPGWG